MNQTILVKKCDNTQLGHLYEHIFCKHIDRLFYDNDLFSYSDYKLAGRTFRRGLVHVRIETYNDKARNIAAKAMCSKLLINDAVLSIALSQVATEKGHPLSAKSLDTILDALIKLDGQPWLDINNIEIINTLSGHSKSHLISLDENRQLHLRKLEVSLKPDDSIYENHPHLLPLFRQLAYLYSENIEWYLSDMNGIYNTADEYIAKAKQQKLSIYFNYNKTSEIAIDKVLVHVLELIKHINTKGGANRLLEQLGNSESAGSPLAPNSELSFADTGVLLGNKGWQAISTVVNKNLVINNLEVETKAGNSRMQKRLLADFTTV